MSLYLGETHAHHDYYSKDTIASSADGVLGSPQRNLSGALIFVAVVYATATAGYLAAGWTLNDAAYMVTLTIFSVGYDEVHPIDTAYLRALTTGTIVLGCTGMIVLTGALVQVFTVFQIRRMLGLDRTQSQIDHLENHEISYGFVIIERDEKKIAEAQALGFLCITADATDEGTAGAIFSTSKDRVRVGRMEV